MAGYAWGGACKVADTACVMVEHVAVVDRVLTGGGHKVTMLSMLRIVRWLIHKPGRLRLLHGVWMLHVRTREMQSVYIAGRDCRGVVGFVMTVV